MKNILKFSPALIITFVFIAFFISCGNNDNGNNGLTDNDDDGGNELPNIDTNKTNNGIYDVEANGIPKFVKVNYIELD